MATGGKDILCRTINTILFSHQFCSNPHGGKGFRPVCDQARVGTVLVATHRHTAHRFCPTGDDAIGKTDHDSLGGQGDGLQSGGAETVDGLRGHINRDTGLKRRYAGDIHPLLTLGEGAAEQYVIDASCIDAGAFHQAGQSGGSQIIRAHVFELAFFGPTARGTVGSQNIGGFHLYPPFKG